MFKYDNEIYFIKEFFQAMATPTQTLFFTKIKSERAWQDSNLQSSDPKSDALSIRPHALHNSLIKTIYQIPTYYFDHIVLVNWIQITWDNLN